MSPLKNIDTAIMTDIEKGRVEDVEEKFINKIVEPPSMFSLCGLFVTIYLYSTFVPTVLNINKRNYLYLIAMNVSFFIWGALICYGTMKKIMTIGIFFLNLIVWMFVMFLTWPIAYLL